MNKRRHRHDARSELRRERGYTSQYPGAGTAGGSGWVRGGMASGGGGGRPGQRLGGAYGQPSGTYGEPGYNPEGKLTPSAISSLLQTPYVQSGYSGARPGAGYEEPQKFMPDEREGMREDRDRDRDRWPDVRPERPSKNTLEAAEDVYGLMKVAWDITKDVYREKATAEANVATYNWIIANREI